MCCFFVSDARTVSDIVPCFGQMTVTDEWLMRRERIRYTDCTRIVRRERHMNVLTCLEIRGFKSIRQESLDLRALNVFIGANGAGK